MNSSANTMTMQIVAPEAQRAGRNHVKAPVDLLPGSSASSLQMEMELWLSLAESINDGDALQHSSRVGLLASRLGLEIGLSRRDVAALDLGARLHDIGKLFIADSILLSPDKLSAASRAVMQTHTVKGAELLARAKNPTVRIAAQVARHHHERWDGSGYPDNLKGRDIPLVARITALADVYDALRHERVYKPAWSHEAAIREIAAGRGTQFDPELTDIFLNMLADDIIAAQQQLYTTDVPTHQRVLISGGRDLRSVATRRGGTVRRATACRLRDFNRRRYTSTLTSFAP